MVDFFLLSHSLSLILFFYHRTFPFLLSIILPRNVFTVEFYFFNIFVLNLESINFPRDFFCRLITRVVESN